MFSSRAFCEPCGVWHAQASLRLHRHVLKDERSALIHVALGADHVLIGRGPQVVVLEGAVHVVAVAALDQAFVHRWWKGMENCGLTSAWHWKQSVGSASLEQAALSTGSNCFAGGVHCHVNRVATDAAHIGLGVGRAHEVGMRSGVATEALGVNVFGRGLGGIEDLGYVAAAGHVLAARRRDSSRRSRRCCRASRPSWCGDCWRSL